MVQTGRSAYLDPLLPSEQFEETSSQGHRQSLDGAWTESGRSLDRVWKECGQTLDRLWTESGRSLDGVWTDSRQSLDGVWTESGQSLDSLNKLLGRSEKLEILKEKSSPTIGFSTFGSLQKLKT